MRRYETIYILRPTLSEDEINAVIDNTNSIINNGEGQTISLDKWGIRPLAYLIRKETQGYYVFCDYATEPNNVEEMERKFRIDESVMKYMTIKLADSITADGIESARQEYEAAAVAAAEAVAKAATEADTESPKPDNRKSASTQEVKEVAPPTSDKETTEAS